MRQRRKNKMDSQIKPDGLDTLLARTGAGDVFAFRALYLLSARVLLQRARRIVGSSESAEDVLQDSFIAIWRDASKYDATRSAPMTWMGAIVRNKAIDFLRTNQQRVLHTVHDDDAGAGEAADTGASPCEQAQRHQQSIIIGRNLNKLKKIHRQAIELSFFQDLSHGEIAAHLTVPLGTVKTWIRRGCRQMRRHMELSGQGLRLE